MDKVNFIKMHGLGNDFVVIDKRSKNIQITKDLINQLSDRKTGAGCDQLITINKSHDQNIDAIIEIFNPNGLPLYDAIRKWRNRHGDCFCCHFSNVLIRPNIPSA